MGIVFRMKDGIRGYRQKGVMDRNGSLFIRAKCASLAGRFLFPCCGQAGTRLLNNPRESALIYKRKKAKEEGKVIDFLTIT